MEWPLVLRASKRKGYGTSAVPTKATPERLMEPLPRRLSRLSTNRSMTVGPRSPRPPIVAAMPGAKAMR